MERKVCFILDATHQEKGRGERMDACPKADFPPSPDNQWSGAFTDRGRRLHTEKTWLALKVILEISHLCGLTSIILVVLCTVHLQLQSQFFPISLRPALRIVAAYVMATVWSSCINS